MTVRENAEVQLPIGGMTCRACVRRIAAALSAVPGVRAVHVTLGLGIVTLDRRDGSLAALHEAIREAGFEPLGTPPPGRRSASARRERAAEDLLHPIDFREQPSAVLTCYVEASLWRGA